jgi:hypothetical protein
MKILRSTIFIILISVATFSCADDLVVTDGRSYQVYSDDIRKEKLSDVRLTVLGITIGKHTLADVQNIMGPAVRLQRGEQQPYQLCYVSKSGNDKTAVIFEAGPLGSWEKITAISLFSDKSQYHDYMQCTKSSKISKNVTTGDGLGLSINQAGLKERLGQPSKEENGNIIYVYEVTEQDSKTKNDWIIYSTVEAIFRKNNMNVLSITKTISG